MRTLRPTLFSLVLLLFAVRAYATVATCAVTGVVYDGAGSPVPNATIYFNSQNTQVVGGNTIYPVLKSSTTDSNGNLSTTALAQGLFVQITICQPQGGGCAAPTTGFVPVTGTTTFQNLLSGQLVAIGTSLSGNLNASGFRIFNLGANTTTGDALSQGVSHLGDLATNNANYNFGGFKFTNLAAGTVSGDSLAFGLNHLNDLATATGAYNMGGFRLTNLGPPTTYLDALSEGNPIGVIQPIPQIGVAGPTASTVLIEDEFSGANDIGLQITANNAVSTTANGITISGQTSGGSVQGVNIDLNTTVTSRGVEVVGALAAQPLFVGSFTEASGPSNFSVSSNGLQIPAATVANLPSCTSSLNGYTYTVTNNDVACAIQVAPSHSTCTVGTNCYTCQVQCAESGSTSYSWLIY